MAAIEVERKRELADVTDLKACLSEAGYAETGTSTGVDTYYSRPDLDFLASLRSPTNWPPPPPPAARVA